MTMDSKEPIEDKFSKITKTLIECCVLNNITPSDFFSCSMGIIIRVYKANGKSVEDLEKVLMLWVKAAREYWTKI